MPDLHLVKKNKTVDSWSRLIEKYEYKSETETLYASPLYRLDAAHKIKLSKGIININVAKTATRCVGQILKDFDPQRRQHYRMMGGPVTTTGCWMPESSGHIFSNSSQKLRILVVRNPFDLLVSYWGHDDGKGIQSFTHDKGYPNFDEWIKMFYRDFYDVYFRKFLFYQPFDAFGNCYVDIAIKFEHMESAFEEIFSHVPHFRPKIPKNVWGGRRATDYRVYYDEKTKAIVEKNHARELKLFRYEFDPGSHPWATMFDMRDIKYNPLSDELSYI